MLNLRMQRIYEMTNAHFQHFLSFLSYLNGFYYIWFRYASCIDLADLHSICHLNQTYSSFNFIFNSCLKLSRDRGPRIDPSAIALFEKTVVLLILTKSISLDPSAKYLTQHFIIVAPWI